ncbi:hypothetical protein Syun_025050 [Stephania yunnanensis]|uniref:Uncharacterized protein n=1 Tax=Stephania yunnanensis TaxID=152371 RepID=A0AAP0EQW6_9MAGN
MTTPITNATTSGFILAPEAKMLREFLKFQPGFFYRGGDPEASGKWIVSYPRFHKLMRNEECPSTIVGSMLERPCSCIVDHLSGYASKADDMG